MFSGFVTAVQRAMLGLRPCPGLASHDGVILISNPGGARHATLDDVVETKSSGESYTLIIDRTTGGHGVNAYVESGWRSRLEGFLAGEWTVYKGETGVKLDIFVDKQAAALSFGLLLAVCSETFEAMPRGSLRTELCICNDWDKAVAIREAADLVAPLGSLAESVAIDWSHKAGDISFVDRKLQTRPLGQLVVSVCQVPA